MPDIIEQAEAALAKPWDNFTLVDRVALVPGLVAELKAARAAAEKWEAAFKAMAAR